MYFKGMRITYLFLCLIVLLNHSTVNAQTNDTLKIGITNSPPFIIEHSDKQYTGLSIYLWESIAHSQNIPFKYVKLPKQELVYALETNAIDVSISPLTVTAERINRIKFSQPYYISHSIAVVKNESSNTSWINTIKRIFSYRFLNVVGLLFLILLFFGFLIWLAERKTNNSEFESNIKGVWSGIWWSAVTMTTVGYGDKSPKTILGRLIGLIWMFAAIIIISGFTGAIASSLTLDKLDVGINSFSDLRKISTGTVKGSASAENLNRQFVKPVLFKSVEDGLNELVNDGIGAFVYDEPILVYNLQSKFGAHNLAPLPFKFHKQYYAFGFHKKSHLDSIINPELLITLRNPTWAALLNEYDLNSGL